VQYRCFWEICRSGGSTIKERAAAVLRCFLIYVIQITDGTFIVCAYADNLDWMDGAVPQLKAVAPEYIH
jgi:hypothetical protein